MPDWVTIIVALVVGLFGGVVGTAISSRHDSRMRVLSLTVDSYSRALAATEEIFLTMCARYVELQTRPGAMPTDEAAVREEVDEIRSKTAAMQAPAKLLGSREVEEALHEFDTVLATKLVPGVRGGDASGVRHELDAIHERLLQEMQKHLQSLGYTKKGDQNSRQGQ